MALTDEHRYLNFIQLSKTCEFFEKWGRVTEDWMAEHKKLIFTYRHWISDYSDVNSDIEDHEFRFRCSEIERMLNHLCEDINKTGMFDPIVYYGMVCHMKKICEFIFSEDELSECMELLQI